MASSTFWDVNKYKSEFESEEHWQLRKKFMMTHMGKFPEDKLVCLARVFFNVEFLGCRYPEKTMKMIAELSKGVADEHRQKQKAKLKRTFVQASDAASAKIKGSKTQPFGLPKKIRKNQGSSVYCYNHINFTTQFPHPSEFGGEFPEIVIFENCNLNGKLINCPISILTLSAQKSGQTLTFSSSEGSCTVKINNKYLASGKGNREKKAMLKAAKNGLRTLRKTCYTIRRKKAFFSNVPSITKDNNLTKASNVTETEMRLPQDNIGSKIMQKMGWSGSGLGKSQQGIEEPVKAAPQLINRAGLGCSVISQIDLEKKIRKVLTDYIKSDSESDLVFSPDFTSDERKMVHMLALKLRLKSRSYGKGNQRHLVVCKQRMSTEMVQVLIECGGENEKYLLIPPTGEVDDESSGDSSVPNVNKIIENDVCEGASLPLEFVKTDSCKITQISPSKDGTSKVIHKPTNKPKENDDGTNSLSNKTSLHALDDDDADICLVDEVLEDKFQNLSKLLKRYNVLMKNVSKLTNKEKREYKKVRNELLEYAGTYIPCGLNPVPANDFKNMRIKHEQRCIALGMALARNSLPIKKLMCMCIRDRTIDLSEQNFYNLENRTRVTELILKEFKRFGNELIKMLLNNHPSYKNENLSIPIYNNLIASNFSSITNKALLPIGVKKLSSKQEMAIPKYILSFFKSLALPKNTNPTPINNLGNNTNKQNKTKRLKKKNSLIKEKNLKQVAKRSRKNETPKIRNILFVKENESESKNEEIEVENSDEAKIMPDVVTGFVEDAMESQLQEGRDLGHSSPVYINFVKSISRQVQPKLPLKQTRNRQKIFKDKVRSSTKDKMENPSSGDISNSAGIIVENLNFQNMSISADNDNEEIGNFFSKVTTMAKSLPPGVFTKLKYNIINDKRLCDN